MTVQQRYLAVPPGEGSEDDEEFTISSNQAYIASATVACRNCCSDIEVICIYCESGIVSGEPLTHFTVSYVWAMDSALAGQLEPWQRFREARGTDEDGSCFANHCPHCGSIQEDMYLHSEPGDPFFAISSATPGTIKFIPLAGHIRLSGDESFEV